MSNEELDALEASFRNNGLTWNQTNFVMAVIRDHIEPLRQQLAGTKLVLGQAITTIDELQKSNLMLRDALQQHEFQSDIQAAAGGLSQTPL